MPGTINSQDPAFGPGQELTDATAMAWVQQEADEAPAARHGDLATMLL
jgi:hypothetical protein